MKKLLSCFSLMLCVLLGTVCFTACGSTEKWITPEFTINNEGYKIELITNAEQDVELPISGVKLDHSKYEENLFEYKWVIKNTTTSEIVGWIDADGGYSGDKNKGFKYGYTPSYSNDGYTFGTTGICVILKSTDVSIFNNMEFTVNHGTLEKVIGEENNPNPYSATKRFYDYDPEVGGEFIPWEGSQNFVCCNFIMNFEGIDPDTIETIEYTLNIPALVG